VVLPKKKQTLRTIYMPFTVFCGANFVTALCCLFFIKKVVKLTSQANTKSRFKKQKDEAAADALTQAAALAAAQPPKAPTTE